MFRQKINLGGVVVRPCSQAFVLASSTKRSKLEKAGETGYKLITENVVDLLDGTECSIISFCTLDTVTDFKLDPPRGSKSQEAFLSITHVLPARAPDSAKQLIAECVQLLRADEVNVLKPTFQSKIYFATIASQMSSRKREREEWTLDENPAKATVLCRTLGRSPTGPELPSYTGSSVLR
jgi:hypothetical protein